MADPAPQQTPRDQLPSPSTNNAATYASILKVASDGFRLSLILNAVSCEVTNAPLEIHEISKSVTHFSLLLKQMGIALQQGDSVHSDEAVSVVKQTADESSRVFYEINDMIERVRTRQDDIAGSPTIQQRFQRSFKKKRIIYFLGQLESLKIKLSLMLQIMQLGKLMASTSMHDPPEKVEFMSGVIRQERMEAQNTVVIHYFQMQEVKTLFEDAKQDSENPTSPIEYRKPTTEDDQQSLTKTVSSPATIEPPPAYAEMTALTKFPSNTLSEIDENLDQMRKSSKDMVQVSDKVIDPLLNKWTRWREIRERRHKRQTSNGRYNPAVDNLYDDDDDNRPYFERYNERENSPRGYYLEGPTTDWRKPQSGTARQEAARLRKQYSAYQPSVSAASSDVDDSPGSNASKKRAPRRHVIDSSSDSSDAEANQSHPQRRSSGTSAAEKKYRPPEANLERSLSTSSPAQPTHRPNPIAHSTSAGPQPGRFGPPLQRPFPTPDQTTQHHSFSSPVPPVHTHNASNVYHNASTAPQSPGGHAQQYYQGFLYPQAPRGPYGPLQTSPGRSPLQQPQQQQQRPVSRDGKPPRSPSRLNQSVSGGGPQARPKTAEEERKAAKKESRKKLGEGARNGLLAGGGIAMFLEALESLSV